MYIISLKMPKIANFNSKIIFIYDYKENSYIKIIYFCEL